MSTLLEQVAQPQDHPTTFIYGLVDPITGFVRYVGKSVSPNNRLRAHLIPSLLKSKSHKNNWLRSLLAVAKKPDLILLEKISDADWENAERRWIAYYRSIPGYPPLTNGTSGGDGIDKGTTFSEETRRKLSTIRKGKSLPPFTALHRNNLSKANKKAWHNLSEEDRKKRRSQLFANLPKEKQEAINLLRRGKMACGKQRFIGITVTHGKYWHAATSLHGKRHYLGCFHSDEEAARAYDRFVLKHIGENVPLNFPRSDYD